MTEDIIVYHGICCMIIWPIAFNLPNVLRASNDVAFCMILSILSMWICRIGMSYVLGNHRLIEERGQCSPALEERLKQHEEAGRTVTLLASPERVIALFAVADTIKPSSREAVASLDTRREQT